MPYVKDTRGRIRKIRDDQVDHFLAHEWTLEGEAAKPTETEPEAATTENVVSVDEPVVLKPTQRLKPSQPKPTKED